MIGIGIDISKDKYGMYFETIWRNPSSIEATGT